VVYRRAQSLMAGEDCILTMITTLARCVVRGVLCSNCNQILGRVKDDVVVLQALIDYVLRYR
jgi:hypothetical protein